MADYEQQHREQHFGELQQEDHGNVDTGAVPQDHQQYYQHTSEEQGDGGELPNQHQNALMMSDAYSLNNMAAMQQQHSMYYGTQPHGQDRSMMMMPSYMQPQQLGGHMSGPIYPRMPLPTEMMEEQPTYVNAKQYRRIVKRRQARAKLEATKRIPTTRKTFLHASRHKHAMRRMRGPGGRFLTKEEVEELARKEGEEGDAARQQIEALQAAAAVAAGVVPEQQQQHGDQHPLPQQPDDLAGVSVPVPGELAAVAVDGQGLVAPPDAEV